MEHQHIEMITGLRLRNMPILERHKGRMKIIIFHRSLTITYIKEYSSLITLDTNRYKASCSVIQFVGISVQRLVSIYSQLFNQQLFPLIIYELINEQTFLYAYGKIKQRI
jgi:hypothetical protein